MTSPERPIDPPEYPSQPITEQDILTALLQDDWSGAHGDILRDVRDRLADQLEDIMHEWAYYDDTTAHAMRSRFMDAIQSAIDDYERRET